MEEKTVETTKKENIFVRGKQWFKEKKEVASQFFTENPQAIMPFVGGLATILFTGFKIVAGSGEKRLESCRVEDDVTGESLLLTHPLTNDEVLELGNRMTTGCSKAEALNEMGLLK